MKIHNSRMYQEMILKFKFICHFSIKCISCTTIEKYDFIIGRQSCGNCCNCEFLLKVDSALPAIDSRPPTVYSHLQLRLKRLQLEEERFAKIYKDNRRLLGRMAAIVATKRIDNDNQQHVINSKLLARG